jgi:hypothetical protein
MHRAAIAAGVAVSFSTVIQHAGAQIIPVSQDRSVRAHAACQGGPTADQVFAAADFGVFEATAQANSSPSNFVYSQMTASQHTTISPTGISGDVSTFMLSRMCPGSSCSSVCAVTFDVTGDGAEGDLTGRYTFTGAAPAPCTAVFTGPDGVIHQDTLFAGGSFAHHVVLAPGRYTLHVQAFPFQSSGGSMMFPGSSMTFDLSLESLVAPHPDGAVVRRPGTCHRYLRLSPGTWLQARELALSMGGSLVTIDDAAEEAFLRAQAGLFDGVAGIGLSDPDGDGLYEWMDGSPVKYTNWGKGQPVAGQLYAYLVGSSKGTSWRSDDAIYQGAPVASIVEFSDCPCDWNLDATVTSADFFAFLTDFFAGDSDLNCSGATDSADFFDFLTCFFGNGC